jgi:fumarylacetoacetase
MLFANDPTRQSWLTTSPQTDFPIQNIPFGIFKTQPLAPRVGTIIGDTVIDLYALATAGFLEGLGIEPQIFAQASLNAFIGLGKKITLGLRDRIAYLFDKNTPDLQDKPAQHPHILHPVQEVEMLLPVEIGDYTDFFSSRQHATNTGLMFRDPANALLPNWLHIPVGYHGRSSSIVVSGTSIHRPKGQTMPVGASAPVFGASQRLDYELEMGFIVGKSTELGESIPAQNTDSYIFGLVLFNDWSARDIQNWEYVPLGPFLGKNFASTMSAWVVVLEAFEGLKLVPTPQDPQPLEYLRSEGDYVLDIELEAILKPENAPETVLTKTNFKHMYWTMRQQLAHHTVNGCNVRIGDLCASGTISGNTPESFGSMLELSWKGTKSIPLEGGGERKFIQDGDSIILRGAGILPNGLRIGFGEAAGKVLAAK